MTPVDMTLRREEVPGDAEGGATHSADGVDLTLIRWMLSLTPAERLETLQEVVWSIMRLRGEGEPEA